MRPDQVIGNISCIVLNFSGNIEQKDISPDTHTLSCDKRLSWERGHTMQVPLGGTVIKHHYTTHTLVNESSYLKLQAKIILD